MSRSRFWLFGRSSTPNFWNSARSWVFTASTVTTSSLAISRFVAGRGNGLPGA
jgi:hypothetical protein